MFSLVVDDTEFKDYPEDLLKDTKEKVREQLDSMYQAQVGISLDDTSNSRVFLRKMRTKP